MDQEQLVRVAVLFKALSDPARLRILGLLAERPMAGHELADRLDLTPPTISHHMRKLVDAGLVVVAPLAQTRVYSLQTEAIRDLSGISSAREPSASPEDGDAISRAFFDGPRLLQIPASRKKRVAVLRRLLEAFEPGRVYPEEEVNAVLLVAHDDYATLRRELVDYGFMSREKGIYRVATELPARGPTVRQEVGDEGEGHWFAELVARATERIVHDRPTAARQTPPSPPK